jgi:signal transduction histidine kinase
VRQPLNNASAALQSAATLLAAKGDEAASARLGRAQGVLGEVLAGVDNTLAAASLLARSGTPALADADIDTLLALVIGDLAPAARDRVRVERLTPTRTALLDLGLVRLALRNLLVNAIAWSPHDAPVLVRVRDSDEPLALLIDVADQGPGIAPGVLTRLFERGARAGPRGGHGLGLFIARRAMALQGGRALVLSSGPGGTVMRLELVQSG